MNEAGSWDEDVFREVAAKRLHAEIREHSSHSFDQMADIAEAMKADCPELAEKIDRVVGRTMLTSMLMPEVVTALFWAQTEPPPIVVEGEVVEEDALSEDEAEETEVQDE